MADNKQLPATGTGTANIVVGTDEITGVDYQQIKLVDGTLGSTTAAIVNAAGSLHVFPTDVEGAGFIVAEDQAASSTQPGVPILGVRNDADATRTDTDGDYSWLSVDAAGKVKLAADKKEDAAGASGDVGILIFGQRNDGPSSRTSTDGDYSAISVDDNGRPRVVIDAFNPGTMTTKLSSPTGTLSNVSASASSVTVLASNGNRRGASIWNDSTAICYLKFGATASTTSCTVKLIADAYYEVPFGYTGIIDGIWAAANGSARVTEIT